MSIDFVLGTRPELTKASSVIRRLAERMREKPRALLTGQQTTLVAQTQAALEWSDYADIVWLGDPSQVGTDRAWRERVPALLSEALWKLDRPHLVVVVGDTDSARLGAEMAHNLALPVAHVEAGIRHIRSQYFIEPEESNRRRISGCATFHLAPFERQATNLLGEGADRARVSVCGDLSACSVAQALRNLRRLIAMDTLSVPQALAGGYEYVVCTFHRSTSLLFQEDLLQRFVEMARFFWRTRFVVVGRTDSRWERFVRMISSLDNVTVLPALDPSVMIFAIAFSRFVITDSAGVQQEALTLGKYVVACREDVELYHDAERLQVVRPPFRRLLPAVALVADSMDSWEAVNYETPPWPQKLI